MKKLKLLLTLIAVSIGSWQASWAQGTETSPIVVNLLEPGSLGTEVLYHVDHVKDVKYLKVTGKMNEDDWTTLSLMDSIIVMDLGDAIAVATKIAYRKFSGYNGKCSSLQTLILPQGLTEIGDNAFDYLKITSITFPSSLKKIGVGAFSNNEKLVNVILPDGVVDIDRFAFSYCTALKSVQLPINIKSIPEQCFSNCSSLNNCPLPDGLEVINYAAFLGCDKLNTRIPQTIKKIGSNAFEYCAIDSVFLPEGVSLEATNDYGGAFNRSKIKYIEFPTSFYYAQYTPIRGCTNLKTVVLKSPTVVGLYQEFFQDINNSDIVIKVPDFVVPSYKLDSYWYNYNIEGFSTEEIDYWRIYQPLT